MAPSGTWELSRISSDLGQNFDTRPDICQDGTRIQEQIITMSHQATICCLLAIFLSSVPAGAATKPPMLYVYLHTALRPNTLQKLIQDTLPDVRVIAFGRYRDFKRKLAESPPDAVLALGPVLKLHNLTPSLSGLKDNKTVVDYVLLSDTIALSKSDVHDKVIGTIDLLGRKNMGQYVAGLLSSETVPKIKRVTKIDDLLALLQFRLADALLLSKPEAERLKVESAMDLRISPIGAVVGLPAVACNRGDGFDICKSIANLPPRITRQLGVEQWQK